MKITDHIKNANGKTLFSFEIVPPQKGVGIADLYKNIDPLMEFKPPFIDVTTSREEYIFLERGNGLMERKITRMRPGTLGICSAIQNKYNVDTVPHVLCGGFTKEETEYVLIDLKFLDINDLLLLRGDKAKHETGFVPTGHSFATELQEQVNRFNDGYFLDGSQMKVIDEPFSYGMACYPEKHEESPNMETELYWAKKKVDNGAEYLVTQMFFDNRKYYDFVEKCREIGIDVPIIPGLKPITFMNQLTVLPRIFKSEIPEEFARELRKCKTDEAAAEVGVEWCTEQARDLISHKVPSIHFYSLMATESVKRVAQQVY